MDEGTRTYYCVYAWTGDRWMLWRVKQMTVWKPGELFYFQQLYPKLTFLPRSVILKKGLKRAELLKQLSRYASKIEPF